MDGTALALKLADVAAPAALTERFPFAIVGHVDHGKSSLIGRLLHDTNSLPEGKFAELKAASDKRGGQFEWSFLLDALQAERDQGITIDTTQIFFQTDKRRYVIIDAPGHKEFLKNAISGVAQAQAAILVIDAAEGVREQTRRHALILQLLGLRQIAVAVNKVDLIGFDQARFDAIAREQIPIVDLYYSKNGKRYRSLGDQDITSPIESKASSISEIIVELSNTRTSERAGRAMDHEREDAFERLRAQGYM